MRNYTLTLKSVSSRYFRFNQCSLCPDNERYRNLRRPQLFTSLLSSSSSLSSNDNVTAPNHTVRDKLLAAATTELKRVKQYYMSDEFNNTNNNANTSSIQQQGEDSPQRVTTGPPLILETTTSVQTYLENIDTIMFDCDGVLYRSPHPTPDVSKAIVQLVREQNKRLLFVTNNGSVSRSQLQKRITSFLQLPSDLLTDDMMITSAYACSQYLKYQLTTLPQQRPVVFCIGSAGTVQELIDAGFTVIHGNAETSSSMTRDDLANYDFSTLLPENSRDDPNTSFSLPMDDDYPTIDAVVIGHDTNFTYRKLCLATVLLQENPTALLVGTNMDSYDITGIRRRHIPGNGALVKAVRIGTSRHYMLHVPPRR